MKRKIVLVLLAGLSATCITACGSSGVTQEEYDAVVAERDELQAQLDTLTDGSTDDSATEDNSSSQETQEFSVGDTWEVDGLFKVTVNSVEESDYRNEFDESDPGAVYLITYTYENIGITDELYVDMESQIVDNSGKMGTSYPGDYELYPQAVPVGASCEAQACIAVENPGAFKDYVSIYDDDYNEYSAIFNLDVQ